MKIFTAAQISEWDKYTIKEEPVAAVDLMERAATACFNWIKENIPVTKNFAIFCGSGNNGGDGLVIARLLHKVKCSLTVYVLDSKKRTDENIVNCNRISALKVKLVYISSAKDFPSILKKYRSY